MYLKASNVLLYDQHNVFTRFDITCVLFILSADGCCKKGLMLLQQNRIAEARAMFTRAIQLDENNQVSKALNNLTVPTYV